VLCMHSREVSKSTATGPTALAMLANSELRVHGDRDERLDLHDLFVDDRRVVLLFPGEGAEVLDAAFLGRDPRPITLVVPDGNWRQAARAARRIPGLERAEKVVLEAGRETEWGVRNEPKEGGLATLEAIARAFGVLESRDVEAALYGAFRSLVRETLAARGARGARGAPTPDDEQEEVDSSREEPLEILYEDAQLVFVNKPAGMLVHRGWGNDDRPLLQRLRDQIGAYVYPVHRLDRGTSGVIAFAKSSEDARLMQEEFESGRITKRYLAVCRGTNPDLCRVDHPLLTDSGDEKKPAITDFRMLASKGRYGLVEAIPRTGRPHQIRRHLKHSSHPILGDVRYGKGEHNRFVRERFGFHRLALHAESLSLVHPRSGAPLLVRAPLPPELRDLLASLELEWEPA